MRLTNGHRGTGLQGIAPVSNIPECWGLHGVYESGALDKRSITLGFPTESVDTCNRDTSPPIRVEGGGITIHRPLLQFGKDRLIATCLNTDTPWFEDHTNENPTITCRNAIRQLLKSGNLPQAVQKPSLLAISWKRREKKVALSVRVEKRLLGCEVKFDVRSGMLVIRLRKSLLQRDHKYCVPEEYRERARQYLRTMAALILRRFLEVVTPVENIPLVKLWVPACKVFPDAFEDRGSKDGFGPGPAESFTVADVAGRRIIPEDIVPGQRSKESDYQDHGWVLTRQPYRKFEPLPMIAFPPETHSRGSSLASRGHWHLWDGRYWIRVHNHTAKLITVRPFEKVDLKPFRNSLPVWAQQRFNDTLSAAAPDKVRWTLPALAAEGEVVALPTLGFAVQKEEYRGLRWQVRYKKVDFGKKELDDPTRWWGGRFSVYLKARGINNEA
jgi:tRNA(Ile)-lysidine synthase